MKLSSLASMPFSPQAIWPELAKLDAAIARIFWLLVVPLALLPPAMLYLTGATHGEAFIEGFGSKHWGPIAVIFFLAEIVSVALMGWLIKQVANTWNEQISDRNAWLLAAVAPIPLWLSSLGLLVPSLLLNAALSFAAMCMSCGLIYQGVRSFCNLREDIQAAAIAQVVFGAGFMLWGVLLSLLVLLPA